MISELDLQRPNSKRTPVSRAFRRHVRIFVSTHPLLYMLYARLGGLRFQLNRHTDVLVDSYPRSANSFFEAAFSRAHGGGISVAHHSHAAGQVLSGVKRGLPAVVLLRSPRDAIASFFEMNGGDYSIELCTREYVAFYTALLPVLSEIIVVETETLEERFFDLMQLLRREYNLKLDAYELTSSVRAELMRDVDETGRKRNGFKAERYSESLSNEEKKIRRDRLDRIIELIEAPENETRFAQAQEVYEKFRRHAV